MKTDKHQELAGHFANIKYFVSSYYRRIWYCILSLIIACALAILARAEAAHILAIVGMLYLLFACNIESAEKERLLLIIIVGVDLIAIIQPILEKESLAAIIGILFAALIVVFVEMKRIPKCPTIIVETVNLMEECVVAAGQGQDKYVDLSAASKSLAVYNDFHRLYAEYEPKKLGRRIKAYAKRERGRNG